MTVGAGFLSSIPPRSLYFTPQVSGSSTLLNRHFLTRLSSQSSGRPNRGIGLALRHFCRPEPRSQERLPLPSKPLFTLCPGISRRAGVSPVIFITSASGRWGTVQSRWPMHCISGIIAQPTIALPPRTANGGSRHRGQALACPKFKAALASLGGREDSSGYPPWPSTPELSGQSVRTSLPCPIRQSVPVPIHQVEIPGMQVRYLGAKRHLSHYRPLLCTSRYGSSYAAVIRSSWDWRSIVAISRGAQVPGSPCYSDGRSPHPCTPPLGANLSHTLRIGN